MKSIAKFFGNLLLIAQCGYAAHAAAAILAAIFMVAALVIMSFANAVFWYEITFAAAMLTLCLISGYATIMLIYNRLEELSKATENLRLHLEARKRAMAEVSKLNRYWELYNYRLHILVQLREADRSMRRDEIRKAVDCLRKAKTDIDNLMMENTELLSPDWAHLIPSLSFATELLEDAERAIAP